jgi:hypothetical protein
MRIRTQTELPRRKGFGNDSSGGFRTQKYHFSSASAGLNLDGDRVGTYSVLLALKLALLGSSDIKHISKGKNMHILHMHRKVRIMPHSGLVVPQDLAHQKSQFDAALRGTKRLAFRCAGSRCTCLLTGNLLLKVHWNKALSHV